MCTTDAVELTQPINAVEPGNDALARQLGLNLLRPLDATATLMRSFDGGNQTSILKSARGDDFATAPCLIAAFGDVHELTQLVYRVGVTAFIDHGVSHFDSFAKNAVAFSGWPRAIKISISLFSRAFSARTRESFLCFARIGLLLADAPASLP